MLETVTGAKAQAWAGQEAAPPPRPAPLRAPRRRSRAMLGFLLLVLLPTALFAGYQWRIAADQYAVELRFAVRNADPMRALPSGGMLSQFGPTNTDAYAVVQHLQSRAALLAVGRHADVRGILGNAVADPLARLDPAAPLEQALRAWQRQVKPYYDRSSGIVTVEVRAFDAAEALALAQGVEQAAEELVNSMSERSRAGLLAAAERETAAAEARFAAAREAVRVFQEGRSSVDPRREAQAMSEHLVKLQGERIAKAAELSRLLAVMREEAVQVQQQRAALTAMDQQIAEVQQQLTSAGSPGGEAALTTSLQGFAGVEAEAMIAQRALEGAMAGLDRARAEAARQQVYLAPVVRPVLPELALYPARATNTATAFAALLLAWFVGLVALRALREHLP
jgi:capsular polysaccharide transport system permease protein